MSNAGEHTGIAHPDSTHCATSIKNYKNAIIMPGVLCGELSQCAPHHYSFEYLGIATVERLSLRDFMEELLSFTLSSHINQSLEFDLRLSHHFCSSLLLPDPDAAAAVSLPNNSPDSFQGVPEYPLLTRLASALYQSIASGSLCNAYDKMTSFIDDNATVPPFLQNEEKWNALFQDKGSELLKILEGVSFEIHVQEPFFSQLKDGRKTVEGRCATSDYNSIKSGDLILVNKSLVLQVKEIRRYMSFSEMLKAEGLAKVLPGVKTIEEGVKVYRRFYTEEEEKSNGVLAISVLKMAAQPYLSLSSILLGLSYSGVQSLLGLANTVGTAVDALPPPRSTLLSSFILPYKPEIKGSTLSHGARALEKHAERSSDNYWGILTGSDSSKNKIAMDVIGRLISHCRWSNIHIVPQHGVVFEVRVAYGYMEHVGLWMELRLRYPPLCL